MEVTAANGHDVTITSKLLHGEEKNVYGNSGYIGAEKHEDAVVKNKNGKKIKYNINTADLPNIRKISKGPKYRSSAASTKSHPSDRKLSMSLVL